MNTIIDAVRKKYPQYESVPDDELTSKIGEKYPQYLKVPDFGKDFNRVSIKKAPELLSTDSPPAAKSRLDDPAYKAPSLSPALEFNNEKVNTSPLKTALDLAVIKPNIEAPSVNPIHLSEFNERSQKQSMLSERFDTAMKLTEDPAKREFIRADFLKQTLANGFVPVEPDKAIGEIATTPLVQFSPEFKRKFFTPPIRLPGTAGEIQMGLNDAAVGITESMTSPLSIGAIGAVAKVPKIAGAVSGAFAVDMARHTPELASNLGTSSVTGTTRDVARDAATLALNTGMAALAGSHALNAKPFVATPPIIANTARAGAPRAAEALEGVMAEHLEMLKSAETSKAVEAHANLEASNPRRGIEEPFKPAPITETYFKIQEQIEQSIPKDIPEPQREAIADKAREQVVAEIVDKIDDATGDVSLPANFETKVQETVAALTTHSPDSITPLTDALSREIRSEQIGVRADIMQFKESNDPRTGTNKLDELSGQWDDYKAGNLLLWEPKNPAEYDLAPGQKYIVANGHHRLLFGKKAGRPAFNSQIIREADGWSVDDAKAYAAEINIADGKGTIYDQSKFLRIEAATHGKDAALARSKLIGKKAGKAATIGIEATDPLFESFINERITPDQAEAIARIAPGDESMQRVGIVRAVKGEKPGDIANFIQAARLNAGPKAQQIDLFGADDSALVAAEQMATRASAEKRRISEMISAAQGASKRPEQAKKLGVNIENLEATKKQLQELRIERDRWDNWSLHPVLVARVKGESALPKLRTGEKQGDVFANQTEDFALVGEKGGDGAKIEAAKIKAAADAKAAKDLADKNQGDMFGLKSSPGVTTNPGPSKTGVKPISLPEVYSAFEKVSSASGGNTPIRFGRFLKKMAGIYKEKPEVARARYGDVATAAHELGHDLAKQLYGSAKGSALGGLPPAVRAELDTFGRNIYGTTVPPAGYVGEGWSEFIRMYLTTDNYQSIAPATTLHFETSILASNPGIAKAITNARTSVDRWRFQEPWERTRAQVDEGPGRAEQVGKVVSNLIGVEAQIEALDPLRRFSELFAIQNHSRLAPGKDPYLIASTFRGAVSGILDTWVKDGVTDLAGNKVSMSLNQAIAPVQNMTGSNRANFRDYLYARRALKLWEPTAEHLNGRNPGISKADAEATFRKYDSPAFALAAQNLYRWQKDVLGYLKQADPASAPTINRLFALDMDYIPLARVFDEVAPTSAAEGARSNPTFNLRGSGRRIKDPIPVILENARSLIGMAHRRVLLNAIIEIARTSEGMGRFVEEVPRNRLETRFNFEQIRKDLDAMGVDTTAVPIDEQFSFWSLAKDPKTNEPIISVKDPAGDLKWFYVDPQLYSTLSVLDFFSIAKIEVNGVKIGPVLDLIFGKTARAFRLGTTGVRASFSFYTNLLRDMQSFVMQTRSGANPVELLGAYFDGMRQSVIGGPYRDAFRRFGAQMAQPLTGDINVSRKSARGLFMGKTFKIITSPIEHLRELFSVTESGPRIAELELIAKRVGWTPGRTITFDQMIQMALAAKRVTVDFTAAGNLSRVLNQFVPFWNATIQGTRSFARSFTNADGTTSPRKFASQALKGLALFTVPTLALWYLNKDKEWYKNLPWRERYLYWNIEQGDTVVQIPRSQEWGNFFAVLPESLFDQWYLQDPEAAEEAAGFMIETLNPAGLPPLFRMAKEQYQNKLDFWQRPIVPRNQVDLQPGDQVSPYTSNLAKGLGQTFPETISPRRVDAGIRQIAGGALPDALNMTPLGSVSGDRELEKSDIPVIGRAFRRGGQFSANSIPIEKFWDDYLQYRQRSASKINPLNSAEKRYLDNLQDRHKEIQDLNKKAAKEPNQARRQVIFKRMTEIAEKAIAKKPK